MQLTTTTRNRPSNDGENLLPSVSKVDNPRTRALIASCGTAEQYFGFLLPSHLSYINEHTRSARANGKSPELVKLMQAYGEQPVVANLLLFTEYTKLMLGQDWTQADCMIIAKTIADTAEARLLWYTNLLGFFHWLISGHYQLYKSRPANVLNAFQAYAKIAMAQQQEMQRQFDDAEKQANYERSLANAMTFEEYRKSTGIEAENPLKALGL